MASPPTAPRVFSAHSTPSVPDSLWYIRDFLLGAGMVILQPSTGRIALIWDPRRQYYFLPKGRKDVGESIEQAALREAYEESGYRATPLPLYQPHRLPYPPHTPPEARRAKTTEAIFVSAVQWMPRHHPDGTLRDNGGEYLSFYYVGFIAQDAVREEDTGMADEKHYETQLLPAEQAIALLNEYNPFEGRVAQKAWELWQETAQIDDDVRKSNPT